MISISTVNVATDQKSSTENSPSEEKLIVLDVEQTDRPHFSQSTCNRRQPL